MNTELTREQKQQRGHGLDVLVTEFWRRYHLLAGNAHTAHRINHSAKEGVIAIHLPTIAVVWEDEIKTPFLSIDDLAYALPRSQKPSFYEYKVITSVINDSAMKCYIFKMSEDEKSSTPPTNNIVTLKPQNSDNAAMVIIHGKQAITTSLKVADIFGKNHKDVLKAIANLECSEDFRGRNFAPTQIDFLMPTGGVRKDTAYNITKNGFAFLAFGFTGTKAAQFKEAYISAFDSMEKQLYRLNHQAIPKTPQDIFLKNHKVACLTLNSRQQRLDYANATTLAETGVDILAHAATFQPEALKALLNTQLVSGTIKQLLDAVHYTHENHIQAAQLLLSQFIRLKNGVVVIGNKCPLPSYNREALIAVPSAVYKVAEFKGTGSVKSILIQLY
jgi:Rha family phage regulatory protein